MPRRRSRIYRRPNSPFWWACWTTPSGEVCFASTGARTRKAAELWLASREMERARADAGLPVAVRISLLDAAARYLVERQPEWAAKWHGTVVGMLRGQAIPFHGEATAVCSVSKEDVARFRGEQIGRLGRNGRPVSPATVNRTMWALAAFGAWCVERRYHTANPWTGHDNLSEDSLPPPSLSPEQVETVIEAVSADPRVRFPWSALFALAAETGLRKSEIARLRWEDYDRTERRLWVVSSNARGHNKARRLRAVALSREASRILDAPWIRREDGLILGPVPDARRAFQRAAKATGLPRVWLHLMRHTAATRIGRAGASLAELIAFGGWNGPSALRMAQRYTHADHRRLLEVIDRASNAG